MQKNSILLSSICIYIVLFSSITHANWQNIGGDLEHTGHAQGPSIPFDLRWKYKVGVSEISAPVVDEGLLFIGSDNNKLYAFDANSGNLKWSYPTLGKVNTPTAKNGMVFASSYDNYIYALDHSGNLIWQYNTGNSISSPPVVYNNKLYGGFDRYVYSIYINNGSLNWKYRTGDIVESSPAIDQGIIYFGSNDNNIYALDAGNMDFKWKYTTRGGISSSPSLINGKLITGSRDFNVYALDIRDGNLKWNEMTNDMVTSSSAVFENSVYIGSNDNFFYSFDLDNGDVQWKFETNDRIESSPIVTDTAIYTGSRDGTIYALSKRGDLINKYSIGSGIISIAISDNFLFVSSQDGYLYAFSTPIPQTPLSMPNDIPDSSPPEIKINPLPLNTTSEKIRISGIARDNVGVLVVTVNGINAGTINWNANVSLSEGINTIAVVAVDKAGNIGSEYRNITYIPEGHAKKNPGFNSIYSVAILLLILYIHKKY